MKIKKIIILVVFLLIALFLLFLLIRINNSRTIILNDKRLTYSDEFKLKSYFDQRVINKVIDNMILIENEVSNSELKVGGFVLIEEFKDNIIETYRVQGTDVTKYTYEKSYDNLVSTTYYHLDEEYFLLLSQLCDKLRKK